MATDEDLDRPVNSDAASLATGLRWVAYNAYARPVLGGYGGTLTRDVARECQRRRSGQRVVDGSET